MVRPLSSVAVSDGSSLGNMHDPDSAQAPECEAALEQHGSVPEEQHWMFHVLGRHSVMILERKYAFVVVVAGKYKLFQGSAVAQLED